MEEKPVSAPLAEAIEKRGRSVLAWGVALWAALMLLPFLGLSDFNTKGEPREAVVSLSMLQQDNWILPVNNDTDIPYKPPLMHWGIAGVGAATGGTVSEYVSRLPSALALIGLTVATFIFFCGKAPERRRSAGALVTAAILLTSFEIYRAGMAARVDMVLTFFIVAAIYSLYNWWSRGLRALPWLAILLMSCATLTKGPVGAFLPCLVAGIFLLLRGVNLWTAFWKLSVAAIISLLLPLCWYGVAYEQGGAEFLDLVMQENFARMTGRMVYESHVNPWWYNIVTLLSGMMPWTITCILALFAIRKGVETKTCAPQNKASACIRRFCRWLTEGDAISVLAFTAASVIFLFYCIPSSKRSVYLMPMYPFCAWGLAWLWDWMHTRRPGLMRGFGQGLAVTATLLFVIYGGLGIFGVTGACGNMLGHIKPQTGAMLSALMHAWGVRPVLWALCAPAGAALFWWKGRRLGNAFSCIMIVSGIYLALSGCWQPAILNTKSVKEYTAEIYRQFPEAKGNLYEYIPASETAAGNPLHFFEINFYSGDSIRNFSKRRPASGYVLAENRDEEKLTSRFGAEGYRFEVVKKPSAALPKHTPSVYRFSKNNATPQSVSQ